MEGSVVTFDFFFEFELFDSELFFSLSEFIVGAFGLEGSSFDFEVTDIVLDFASETFEFLAEVEFILAALKCGLMLLM